MKVQVFITLGILAGIFLTAGIVMWIGVWILEGEEKEEQTKNDTLKEKKIPSPKKTLRKRFRF